MYGILSIDEAWSECLPKCSATYKKFSNVCDFDKFWAFVLVLKGHQIEARDMFFNMVGYVVLKYKERKILTPTL